MKLFTLGYQGLDLCGYARELIKVGAGTVIDVRERAWSNRPDFVKSALELGLATSGINYVHVKAAGNPSSIRKTAQSAEECLTKYRRHLQCHHSAVEELYSFVRLAAEAGKPACLLCYERNPHECHRSVLLEMLREIDSSVRAIHLPFRSETELRPFETVPRRRVSVFKTAFVAPLFLPFN
jgi:uncharacterized protein (DUF488 family)